MSEEKKKKPTTRKQGYVDDDRGDSSRGTRRTDIDPREKSPDRPNEWIDADRGHKKDEDSSDLGSVTV